MEEFCKYLKEDQEGRLICILYAIDCYPEKHGCNSPSPIRKKK